MNFAIETIALGLAAFLALLGAGFAQDNLFQAHMWVLFFVLTGATIVLMRVGNYSPQASAATQSE